MPLALGLWMMKRYSDALEVLERPGVESACGHLAYFHALLGMVARQVNGKHLLARNAYQRALEIEPDRYDTLYNLANLIKEDQPEEADQLYRRSLAINPRSSSTWHNFGVNLNSLNRPLEAIAPLKISLQLDALNPEVWCNLGLAYYGSEDYVRAERSFRHTIALDSKHSPGYQILGNTLISALRPEETMEILEKGVQLDKVLPTHCGIYPWPIYCWGVTRRVGVTTKLGSIVQISMMYRRRLVLSFRVLLRPLEKAMSLWLFGASDVIQFCRYLHLLDAASNEFVFATKFIREWTGYGERVQPFESFNRLSDKRQNVALMSLPALFTTELHTVPSHVPYLHTAQASPNDLLLERPPGGLNVGLVWASNPDNKAMYRNKSMPLAALMPVLMDLVQLGLIELHSLQFGQDANQLKPWLGVDGVNDWHERLKDFSDTAIWCASSLVISVDTAVAHLAGALNRLPGYCFLKT